MWKFTSKATDVLNGFVCQKGLVQIILHTASQGNIGKVRCFDAIHRSQIVIGPDSEILCKTQEKLEI